MAILLLLGAGLMGGVAVAWSGTGHVPFSGRFIDHPRRGTVSFGGKLRHGRVTRVLHFAWADVPITCHQGRFHLVRQHFGFAMVVKDRAFLGRARAHTGAGRTGRFSWSVTGHFGRRFNHARGDFRAWGDYSFQATGCDTGKLPWTARRS